MIGFSGSGMGGTRSRAPCHEGAERAEDVRLAHPDVNQHGAEVWDRGRIVGTLAPREQLDPNRSGLNRDLGFRRGLRL